MRPDTQAPPPDLALQGLVAPSPQAQWEQGVARPGSTSSPSAGHMCAPTCPRSRGPAWAWRRVGGVLGEDVCHPSHAGLSHRGDRRRARGGHRVWALPISTLDKTRSPARPDSGEAVSSFSGRPATDAPLPLCCFLPPRPRREHRLRLPVSAEGAQADGARGRSGVAVPPPPHPGVQAPHWVLPSARAARGGQQARRKWPAGRRDRPGAAMFLSPPQACVTQRRMP